jgi:hypothetical protein
VGGQGVDQVRERERERAKGGQVLINVNEEKRGTAVARGRAMREETVSEGMSLSFVEGPSNLSHFGPEVGREVKGSPPIPIHIHLVQPFEDLQVVEEPGM